MQNNTKFKQTIIDIITNFIDMDSNSKIPKPASFKKPQTSSTSSFDFSSFRSFQSNNMSDRVKSNLEMFDKKPLSGKK